MTETHQKPGMPISPQSAGGDALPLRRWPHMAACLLLACGAVAEAHAVELGDIRVHSRLGQQLRASVALVGEDAQDAAENCFHGAVLNAGREPLTILKVAMQRSSRGAFLLLAGGNAVGDPAATVVVQNTCGTGANREYAIALAAAPGTAAQAPATAAPKESENAVASQPEVSSVAKHAASAHTEDAHGAAERGAQMRKLQKALAEEEALARKLKALETKVGASLSSPGAERMLRGSAASLKAAKAGEDDASTLVLKLDRSLAFTQPAASADRTASMLGVFSLVLVAAAAAWIFLRFRAMGTAKPLVPGDPAS